MGRRPKAKIDFDRELRDLPEPMRRREFMVRVEAVIFASSRPVKRDTLAALIGSDCQIDELIEHIGQELHARPYEIVEVAGGFQFRTRSTLAKVIRASGAIAAPAAKLSPTEQIVLTAIAYFQPVTRMEIADMLGKPIHRYAIAALRSFGLIASGPRSPQRGAPYTYVTTAAFLELTGLPTLFDLPDLDKLEAAGLLGKAPLPQELRSALGIIDDIEVEDAAASEAEEEFDIGLIDEDVQS
jgi:segregation and condensation protein B